MSTAETKAPSASTALALDHIVLTVRSIPDTIAFYSSVLGMQHIAFTPPSAPDQTRHALKFGNQKINLHQAGKEFEPKAAVARPGTADLCFLVDEDVQGVVLGRLKEQHRLEVLEGGGVVERTGAMGKLRSVYVRDPDGNLIELSNLVS